MSFSFRNIFSQDDPGFDGNPQGAIPEGFSANGGVPGARGSLAPSTPPSLPQGSYQDFLAGELLAFIPPAISARSGIPMDREVRVPVPASGSLEVKLSTLYELCPDLFAAEITPLNDSTVTLPPRLGATPLTAASPGPMKGFNPAGNRGEDVGNPFWSPLGTESGDQPSTASAARLEGVNPASTENPFSAAETAASGAFSPPSAQSFGSSAQPPGKLAGGFDALAEPPVAKEASSMEFSGFTGFSGFAGFDTASGGGAFGGAAPAAPSSHGPEPERKASNPFESQSGFATLFSKQAEADAAIPFPDTPSKIPADEPVGVWGAMFGGAFTDPDGPEPAGVESTPPGLESIGNLLKQGTIPSGFDAPAPVETPPPAKEPEDGFPFGGFSNFFPPPPSPSAMTPPPFSSAPSSANPPDRIPAAFSASPTIPAEDTGLSGFGGIGGNETALSAPPPMPSGVPFAMGFDSPFSMEAPPAKEAVPSTASTASTEVTPAQLASDPPARSGATIPPETVGAPVADEAPAELAALPAAPCEVKPAPDEPDVPPSREVPRTDEEAPFSRRPESRPVAAPTGSDSPDSRNASPVRQTAAAASGEERDLELRAIFSTSESFTLAKVARRVVGLPGIRSCSLSTPVKIVQASRSEESRLGNEARDMVTTLKNLAKLTGLPEARTFTLQTDRGIVSLFLEGDYCVTIHHDAIEFAPGVREKLILIARSLVKLNE